jgi:hypothetical protein
MEPKQVIETTGTITKVENLAQIDYHTLDDTLVLESKKQLSGLVTRTNSDKPEAVYLVLLYRYFPEKISRLAKALKEKYNAEWWSASGEIIIKNKVYPIIRIKGLSKYDYIPVIQDFYKSNDIKFAPYRILWAPGRIIVHKHFRIIELIDGIYRDLYEPERFYFVVPEQLTWNMLVYFTRHVKSNLENPAFDAALGVINRFSGPEDVIRIFDRDKTLERALLIRNQYLKILKRESLLIRQRGS